MMSLRYEEGMFKTFMCRGLHSQMDEQYNDKR